MEEIKIENIKTDLWNPSSVSLTWELSGIEDTDLSKFSIDIYRSDAPQESIDDYKEVETGVSVNSYQWDDPDLEGLENRNRTWYYFLKLRNEDTGEEEVFPEENPAYVHKEAPNPRYKKIHRLKSLSLRKGGRAFYLAKRRTYDYEDEVDNFDEILFRIGSGPAVYYDPMKLTGMIANAPKVSQMTPFGEFMPSDSILYTLSFPPLSSRDLLIDPLNGDRFILGQIRSIDHLGHPIEQQAQLQLVDYADPTYRIFNESS